MNLIGKRVRWELAGRGRGTILEGEVVMHIPPGISNRDALEQLKAQYPDLIIRPKYCRFDMDTHKTNRVFVLVDRPTKRNVPLKWIYAPNFLEVKEI